MEDIEFETNEIHQSFVHKIEVLDEYAFKIFNLIISLIHYHIIGIILSKRKDGLPEDIMAKFRTVVKNSKSVSRKFIASVKR